MGMYVIFCYALQKKKELYKTNHLLGHTGWHLYDYNRVIIILLVTLGLVLQQYLILVQQTGSTEY